MKTKSKKKSERRPRASARPQCKHHCYHLLDGYMHGRDLPPGMVKEECCHCEGTRIIPRGECAEIARKERERTSTYEQSVCWRLTEPCRRTRVTFDAGRGRAA